MLQPISCVFGSTTGNEALQDKWYIQRTPGLHFGMPIKTHEITHMAYFWGRLDRIKILQHKLVFNIKYINISYKVVLQT